MFEKLLAIFISFEIVVCKLFQFGRVKNLLFGKGLMTLRNIASEKNVVNGQTAGKQHFLLFSKIFSDILQTEPIISATFVTQSANAFHFDQSKIVFFHKKIVQVSA